MGWTESAATDICGYEARAVEMCILNIDLKKRPTKIRYLKFSKSSLKFTNNLEYIATIWELYPALPITKGADTLLLSNKI